MYLKKLENYINDNLKYDDYKEMINYHLKLYLSFFLKDDYNLKNINISYEDYYKCTNINLYFENYKVIFWFREKHCCNVLFEFMNDNIKISSSLLPKFGVEYVENDCYYKFGEIKVVKDSVIDIKELQVSKFDFANSAFETFTVDIPKIEAENNISIIYQIIDIIKMKNRNYMVRNREKFKL